VGIATRLGPRLRDETRPPSLSQRTKAHCPRGLLLGHLEIKARQSGRLSMTFFIALSLVPFSLKNVSLAVLTSRLFSQRPTWSAFQRDGQTFTMAWTHPYA